MSKRQSMACKRLRAIGLKPERAYPLLDLFEKWKRESGEEWTVQRLKTVKQALMNRIAGVPYELPWIRSSNGIPKGPLGWLFECADKDTRHQSLALNTVMIYSSLISDHVTDKQRQKFVSSVVTPEPVKSLRTLYGVVRCAPSLGKVRVVIPPFPKRIEDHTVSHERRAPAGVRTVPETEVGDWLPYFFTSQFNREVFDEFKPYYNALLQGLYGDHFSSSRAFDQGLFKRNRLREYGVEPPPIDPGVGKISFLQEPGYKLRAVANPNRLHQWALSPLKTVLLNHLTTLQQDCTHDQGKPLPIIQEWLRRGRTVSCIDLSDATNQFPLVLQEAILKKLLPDHWSDQIRLFITLSRGPWVYRDEGGQLTHLRWEKGQPLGLGPSFPAFALSHHALVRHCIKCSGAKEEDYFLLGDDIVLADLELAKAYRSALDDLGCPVSEPKCMTSNLLAEFAGKVITRESVISTFKWREPSDRSFLDVARQLGHQSISLFKPRQQSIIRKIAEVPEELGGLGWNPKGLSFEARAATPTALLLQEIAPDVSRCETPDSKRRRYRDCLDHDHKGFGLVIPSYSAKEAKGPRPEVLDSVKERVLSVTGVTVDIFQLDAPHKGWVQTERESDPRGPTTLSVLERKLKRAEASQGVNLDADDLVDSQSPR